MPNWLGLGLLALSKLPIEKMFYKRPDPIAQVDELAKRLTPSNAYQTPSNAPEIKEPVPMEPVGDPAPVQPEVSLETEDVISDKPKDARITTPETVEYQKRELGKEIMLLEKHLQQKCKIFGRACDCCEKHPIVVEGLAQETLGMTGDRLYEEVANWAKKITPMTTEAASRSGKYDDIYPDLAVEGRNLRKRILGTADVKAMLSPELSAKVNGQVTEILNRTLKQEGESNDARGTEDTGSMQS